MKSRAEQKPGKSFDNREFHHIMLQSGCIPLTILEEQINQWIKFKIEG
ncbi:hypothetical protein [Lutimonas vermicola]